MPSRFIRFVDIKLALIGGVFGVATFSTSRANDMYGAVGIGGIVLQKTDAIAVQKEVLDISYKEIKVDYDFVNESNKDIATTVSFPVPVYSADPPESGGYPGMPGGFSVEVDGRPAKLRTLVRAIQGDKDVTKLLKKVGYKESDIVKFPFDDSIVNQSDHSVRLSPNKIEFLKSKGLIDKDNTQVLFAVEIVYQWEQKFPAHNNVHVSHRYKPLTAWRSMFGDSEGTRMSDYCVDETFKKKWLAMRSDATTEKLDSGEISATTVDYILKSANSWKDSIRHFTLLIHKQKPTEVISLCFTGKLVKKDALTFESIIDDFHPEADLHIFFGNVPERESVSGSVVPPIYR